MSQILGLLSPIGIGRKLSDLEDDDFLDRIHHTYTVMILIIMSVIVSTKTYVGDHIHCWVPGHFTRNHETYANKACWVSSTYYLPPGANIPIEGARREWINYYQWLPMILLAQAALFYAPVLVWRRCSGKIGVQVRNIVNIGRTLHDSENKANNLRYMVRQVDRYLCHYREEHDGSCCTPRNLVQRTNLLCGKRRGNYLMVLYLSCKMLYFVNCLGQFFMMDLFLGTDYHFYGFHAIKTLFTSVDWPGSSRFPTYTICDYSVRQMGHNIHRTTVQCVLPINFFNDKLYLALWLWFFIVSIATALNGASWFCHTILPQDGVRYIRRHLRASQTVERSDKVHTKSFINEYLRSDGIIIIRLVQINCSDIVASELTAGLYDYHVTKPLTLSKKQDDPSPIIGEGGRLSHNLDIV